MPVVITQDCFDPFAIMESGQCFRMVRLDEYTVETVAFGRRTAVTALGGGRYAFDCTQAEFDEIWCDYFDLDTDYAAILAQAPKTDACLCDAAACRRGLRILRQEPWETLCSFILSQQKNIGAIRAAVETLCVRYGEPVAGADRRAFPTAERLAALSESELRACSLGYRAPYLFDAATKAASGALDFDRLALLPDNALFDALTAVSGVGKKVADCVLLFGFHRLSRAPVDVWIRRVIDSEFGGVSPFSAYGEYAGVYQQYLFMQARDQARAEGVRSRERGNKASPQTVRPRPLRGRRAKP
jgi:N-glycosylase/DNA lyase